jgi:hypothetical protein
MKDLDAEPKIEVCARSLFDASTGSHYEPRRFQRIVNRNVD